MHGSASTNSNKQFSIRQPFVYLACDLQFLHQTNVRSILHTLKWWFVHPCAKVWNLPEGRFREYSRSSRSMFPCLSIIAHALWQNMGHCEHPNETHVTENYTGQMDKICITLFIPGVLLSISLVCLLIHVIIFNFTWLEPYQVETLATWHRGAMKLQVYFGKMLIKVSHNQAKCWYQWESMKHFYCSHSE